MDDEMKYIGIDIGGSYIKYGLVDEKLQFLKQWKKETKRFMTASAFYDYLCEGLPLDSVERVGISAPGVIDEHGMVMSEASKNVAIMFQTNVVEEVENRINRVVNVVNDAKAAGYCEYKIGNGKGSKRSAYFIIGTGIGGCLCDEQGVIYGCDGLAGEFSYIPVLYGKQRSRYMSQLASMSALLYLYEKASGERLDGEAIAKLYLQGDAVACEVMEEWCYNICCALYTIIFVYNPAIICIGGGISEATWFIEKIQMMMKSFYEDLEGLLTTQITSCFYHNDANILGAVLTVMEK